MSDRSGSQTLFEWVSVEGVVSSIVPTSKVRIVYLASGKTTVEFEFDLSKVGYFIDNFSEIPGIIESDLTKSVTIRLPLPEKQTAEKAAQGVRGSG